MGDEDLSRWSDGVIIRDDCMTHVHMEWICDCERMDIYRNRQINSPLIFVGDQTYALSLRRIDFSRESVVEFSLYRKGPSVDAPRVRWWAGLQLWDGPYCHRNQSGYIYQSREFSAMEEEHPDILTIRNGDFFRDHLRDYDFTFSFRMEVEQASTRSKICTHVFPEETLLTEGNISQNVCPSHSRVEWDFEGPWRHAVLSPAFTIASQQYFLELRSYLKDKSLHLYRKGPSVDGPSRFVRWWAGLKCGDGTYNHSHEYFNLDLDQELLMWTLQENLLWYSNDIFRALEKKGGGFTVIFQLNVEQESATEQTCTHGNLGISPSFQGTLTEDRCSSHKRVEWTVRSSNAISPVFEVAKQRYLLRLKSKANECFLYLHRMGPSVDGSVRWWAGLKLNDGTYLPWLKSGDLNQEIEFSMFKSAERLLHIKKHQYRPYSEDMSDGFTVFFQISTENASTTTKTCHHDSAEVIFPVSDGSILDGGFTCHKQVEWIVDYDRRRQRIWTSPLFSTGNQSYRFLFSRQSKIIELHLYRLGPSNDTTKLIEFSAGLERRDETDHHKDHSGVVSLQERCGLWSHAKLLASIYPDDFLSYHLSKEGRFTLFFRMDAETGEKCTHDSVTAEESSWDHGEISQGCCDCPSHKHVEWRNVNALQLMDQRMSQCISPPFSVGNQSYALTLLRDSSNNTIFRLELLRKGCSATDTPVRWWARLKRKYGTFDYRNAFGKLDLNRSLSNWTTVKRLLSLSEDVLKRDYVAAGRITAFFLMTVEHASTSPETCTNDTQELYQPFDGRLEKDYCPFHKRVKWIVERGVKGENGTARSSIFEIARQRYILEFSEIQNGDRVLRLYRKGPACTTDDPSGPLQWWAGLLHSDRRHSNRNEYGDLNLEEKFSMWTEAKQLLRIASSDYESYFERKNRAFTAVFQLNVRQASTRAVTCNHDFRWMTPPSAGSIEQTPCPIHKRVDWNYNWRTEWAVSPVFEVENQRYLLELRIRYGDEVTLSLYRMGPPAGYSTGSIRWWAGLKRRDKAYHHTNQSGNLNLAGEFWMWAKEEQLLRMAHSDFERYILQREGKFDAFFQMDVKGSSTTKETCSHDLAQAIFPRNEGKIREEKCISHHHVEWILDYDEDIYRKLPWASDGFVIRNQRYRLLFSIDAPDKKALFDLYALGPYVDLGTSVQWWAGLKLSDGTYQNRNESGELSVREGSELWSEVARLKVVELQNLRKCHVDERNNFTFFFRVNQKTQGARVCVHEGNERFPLEVGSITETKWTSYKLHHWNLDFDVSDGLDEDMASPVFKFNDQSYLLELVDVTPPDSRRSENASTGCDVSLRLCRMGAPDKRSVKWWAGVMPRDGTFHEYGSAEGELSLGLCCKLWSFASDLHSFTIHSHKEAKRMQLTVDFLMSSEKSPPEEEERINDEDQAVQDVDHLAKDDIIFKVNGEGFKVPRALVCFGAPVLGRIFLYDNMETRSGEMNLVDCEPTAVAEFLELLKGGFRQAPTERNSFHLYCLAHQYLLGNLMQNCLPHIVDYMSVDKFCFVASFCFKYQDKDLLNSVVTFLSQNREIIDSNSFEKLKAVFPKDVNDLIGKALPPAN